MKKYIVIFLICLFNFTACTTFPPPHIEGGHYINSKYGFSIVMPKGWHQTEKIPVSMKDFLSVEEKAQIRIMFFNNDTNGFICIETYKTFWSLDLVLFDPEKSKNNFRKLFEKQKKKYNKDPYVKNYDYTFYDVQNFYDKFSFEYEFQKLEIRSTYKIYECCGDDTCIIKMIIVSDIKTYDENYRVFSDMTDSFVVYK